MLHVGCCLLFARCSSVKSGRTRSVVIKSVLRIEKRTYCVAEETKTFRRITINVSGYPKLLNVSQFYSYNLYSLRLF